MSHRLPDTILFDSGHYFYSLTACSGICRLLVLRTLGFSKVRPVSLFYSAKPKLSSVPGESGILQA
jgi:hypothetical protein